MCTTHRLDFQLRTVLAARYRVPETPLEMTHSLWTLKETKKKKIIKIALALFLCLIHSFAAAMEWRGRQKYFGKKADNYYLEYRCVYTAQRYTLEMIDYFNID